MTAKNNLPVVQLKKHEDRRLLNGHLWVYSNEIDTKAIPLKSFIPGSLVSVVTNMGKPIGIGYINPHSLLCVRILTRNLAAVIDKDFFVARFQRVLALREQCFTQPYYRLVFGESDRLPGLVVDRYGEFLVVQLNTAGVDNLRQIIVDALVEALQPRGILLRSDSAMRVQEGLESHVTVAYGHVPAVVSLIEHGVNFTADVFAGQKTGWFYDQSANRSRLPFYVKDKRVLDVFSYTGSWGIQAAVFGAQSVVCVDSSESALGYVKQHAILNKVVDKLQTIHADAVATLQELLAEKKFFDVIVLDPPAFIKRHKDIVLGTQAYLQLHKLALLLLAPGGVLFTCSCSMHMSRDALLNVARQAALKANKQVVVIEQLHQAQDHPVHPAIDETDYLKGFVMRLY